MTFIEPRHQNSREAVLPPPPFHEEDVNAWPSGELARMSIAPVLVALLFVGGVYWIRHQPPAGAVGQQQNSVVQVQLLPRPDPAPIPVAAAPSVTGAVASRVDTPSKEPDPTPSDDPPVTRQGKSFSPADTPPANATPAPASAPPSAATMKFQQALLRHIARYQRYPNAARSLHLEGKVDTLFAMSRDGTLLGVWVRTSSGQILLDNEAIDTIRRAQPLPRIPSELPDRLSIHLQLVFDPS